MMRKTRDSTRLECENEMERLRYLEQQRMKQEAIVKHLENNNEVYYIKIRKTVEAKVNSILSNSKMLLKLALLSLTESMRKDPDKFNALIFMITNLHLRQHKQEVIASIMILFPTDDNNNSIPITVLHRCAIRGGGETLQ